VRDEGGGGKSSLSREPGRGSGYGLSIRIGKAPQFSFLLTHDWKDALDSAAPREKRGTFGMIGGEKGRAISRYCLREKEYSLRRALNVCVAAQEGLSREEGHHVIYEEKGGRFYILTPDGEGEEELAAYFMNKIPCSRLRSPRRICLFSLNSSSFESRRLILREEEIRKRLRSAKEKDPPSIRTVVIKREGKGRNLLTAHF